MFKVILVFTLLFISFISAQSVEECMDCHSDNELTKFVDDTVEISLYVDLEQYSNSIHGDMECIDCHADIEDVEHDENLAEVNCGECHETALEEYTGSIHNGSHDGEYPELASCQSCHGTHNILPSDNPESLTYNTNIESTCAKCHSSPEVIKTIGLRGAGPAVAYHTSIHERILMEEPEKGAPTCISCHGSHEIYFMSDPRSSFNKINRAETCGTCHTIEKEEYMQSIHWRAVQRGHFESPTCNDCHGEHGIQSPQDKDAATNRLNLSSQVCANCHASQAMMKRFGLDHGQFKTYMKTYHGLALLKGSPDAANCTSCHEIHAIREHSSDKSSVHPTNLVKTCGKCHDDVSAEFIGIAVHPKDMKTRNPIAYYAEIIYISLIIVVVGGMLVHNIILLSYFIRKKRQSIKSGRTFQRFQPFEVYQHMFLIISFFMLVITGFALKFPDALWVQWLVSFGMTEEIRSVLHRIAAVVMIIASFIQLGYFILHKKGRKDISQLMPNISDITGFWKNMKYHLGFSTEKPKYGRWDYTEKAEYLALIWGTAIMVLTGIVLWFPEFFMNFLPVWMFEVSEVIHYFEAWLATLAIVIWHWFLVIYHPEKYPMSLTWMDGKITEEELKHHHSLEYDELSK
jgi:formate dehydrogenase gamma subunit